jgi:hypothetical protein
MSAFRQGYIAGILFWPALWNPYLFWFWAPKEARDWADGHDAASRAVRPRTRLRVIQGGKR